MGKFKKAKNVTISSHYIKNQFSAIKAKAFYIDLILFSSRKADNIKIIFHLVGGNENALLL